MGKTGSGWSTVRSNWFSTGTSSGKVAGQKMTGTVKLQGNVGSWCVGVILRGYNSAFMSYNDKAWYYEVSWNGRGTLTHNGNRLPGFFNKAKQGDELTVEVKDCILTFKLNGVEMRRVHSGNGRVQPKVRLPEGTEVALAVSLSPGSKVSFVDAR